MWWEWVIVVSVVGGAAVWLVLRFRRATTGRSDCDCGCGTTCPAAGGDSPSDPTTDRSDQPQCECVQDASRTTPVR